MKRWSILFIILLGIAAIISLMFPSRLQSISFLQPYLAKVDLHMIGNVAVLIGLLLLVGVLYNMGSGNGYIRAKVADEIFIDPAIVKGFIAVRTWKVFSDGTLCSLNKSTVWGSRSVVDSRLPDKNNNEGIYAYRIGSSMTNLDVVGRAFGIVELTGRFEYHPDGVLRASKCEIKMLVCSEKDYGKTVKASIRYKVPLYVSSHSLQAYHDWLFSGNGLACLQHNYDVLSQPTIFEDVETILGGR